MSDKIEMTNRELTIQLLLMFSIGILFGVLLSTISVKLAFVVGIIIWLVVHIYWLRTWKEDDGK